MKLAGIWSEHNVTAATTKCWYNNRLHSDVLVIANYTPWRWLPVAVETHRSTVKLAAMLFTVRLFQITRGLIKHKGIYSRSSEGTYHLHIQRSDPTVPWILQTKALHFFDTLAINSVARSVRTHRAWILAVIDVEASNLTSVYITGLQPATCGNVSGSYTMSTQ
jgi:hypothetical protein